LFSKTRNHIPALSFIFHFIEKFEPLKSFSDGSSSPMSVSSSLKIREFLVRARAEAANQRRGAPNQKSKQEGR